MFDLVAKDSERYFRRVLRNMTRCRRATGDDDQFMFVRAGTTGNGTAPNYQIENSEGRVISCYSGLSHKKLAWEVFNPRHVTRPYNFYEIQGIIGEHSER